MNWLSLTQLLLLLSFSVTPKIHSGIWRAFHCIPQQVTQVPNKGHQWQLITFAWLSFPRVDKHVKLLVSTQYQNIDTRFSAPLVLQQKLSWNAMNLQLERLDVKRKNRKTLQDKAESISFWCCLKTAPVFNITTIKGDGASFKLHSLGLEPIQRSTLSFAPKHIRIRRIHTHYNPLQPRTLSDCSRKSPNLDIFFLTHRHHGILPWIRVSTPWDRMLNPWIASV